jgi:hypothetical protein
MKTMQEEWREYRDKIYKHGLPYEQNKECHQAFFAGAFVLLTALTHIGSNPDEDEALKATAALEKEIREIMHARCAELMATLN